VHAMRSSWSQKLQACSIRLDPWQRKLSAQYITKQSTYTSAAARTSSTTGNDNVVSGGSYILLSFRLRLRAEKGNSKKGRKDTVTYVETLLCSLCSLQEYVVLLLDPY
jgi:hypothetical protein